MKQILKGKIEGRRKVGKVLKEETKHELDERSK
jgi:hypothetical protein